MSIATKYVLWFSIYMSNMLIMFDVQTYHMDAISAGRVLTLEDDGGRCRATGDDEVMQDRRFAPRAVGSGNHW